MENILPHVHDTTAAEIVQLCGAYPGSGLALTALDLVRELGRETGAEVASFFAPLLAIDIEAADAIRRQADVRHAHTRFGDVTIAVGGSGGWARGESTVADSLDDATFASVAEHGVTTEIAGGVQLTHDGAPIETEVSRRAISISAAELARIPSVIGLAFGAARAPAVLAAVRGGYVNNLVIDDALAEALLARSDPPDSSGIRKRAVRDAR